MEMVAKQTPLVGKGSHVQEAALYSELNVNPVFHPKAK